MTEKEKMYRDHLYNNHDLTSNYKFQSDAWKTKKRSAEIILYHLILSQLTGYNNYIISEWCMTIERKVYTCSIWYRYTSHKPSTHLLIILYYAGYSSMHACTSILNLPTWASVNLFNLNETGAQITHQFSSLIYQLTS